MGLTGPRRGLTWARIERSGGPGRRSSQSPRHSSGVGHGSLASTESRLLRVPRGPRRRTRRRCDRSDGARRLYDGTSCRIPPETPTTSETFHTGRRSRTDSWRAEIQVRPSTGPRDHCNPDRIGAVPVPVSDDASRPRSTAPSSRPRMDPHNRSTGPGGRASAQPTRARGNEYLFNTILSKERTACRLRHWQRLDPVGEGFYAVADVDFGAGSTGPCAGDLDGDGRIGGADLTVLLGAWGSTNGSCGCDLDGDGSVDGADLSRLLADWGLCGEDCNGNGIADHIDIESGATDCNVDGIPDDYRGPWYRNANGFPTSANCCRIGGGLRPERSARPATPR